MRLLLLLASFAILAILGCGDGKLNLSLVLWGIDPEEDLPEYSSSSEVSPPLSSIPPESSSSITPSVSSSSTLISSSSSEEPPPASSSSRPEIRSSSSKPYEEYPTLDPEDPTVGHVGLATRYWDACKPSGTWIGNIVIQNGGTLPNPFIMGRNCDKNGREMPLFFKQDSGSYIDQTGELVLTHQLWQSTPTSEEGQEPNRLENWLKSPEYSAWQASYPGNFPGGEAYTCTDQIPYAVNDTLSYAFAASDVSDLGKCFLLQFTGKWENGGEPPRRPHIAIKGKRLIVLVSNLGVGKGFFDLMIPGGGIGNCKGALIKQLDFTQAEIDAGRVGQYDIFGKEQGGLLTECFDGQESGSYADIGVGFVGNRGNTGERVQLEEWQECLRAKCNRAFKNNSDLLKGCMWHADWLMAADNPETLYKEVACPQYLIDKHRASPLYSEFPKAPPGNVACVIDGTPCPR